MFTTQILLIKTTEEDVANGLFQQGLLGRLLKFGEVAAQAQAFVAVSKAGPVDQVLMVDVLLK